MSPKLDCEAGCGREAEVDVWTDTWALEEDSYALNLCHECTVKFLQVRYEQECDDMHFPTASKEADKMTVVCPRCQLWHVLPLAHPRHYPPELDHQQMTVGDLVQMLSFLPRDTPVVELCWMGALESKLGWSPFYIYERDGEVALHVDDEDASHPVYDPYRKPLLEWYRERTK